MSSMGNMKPLRMTVGSNMPISEANMAACCDSVTMEIRMPSVRQVVMKSVLSPSSNGRLPRMGRSSTVTLKARMASRLMTESRR